MYLNSAADKKPPLDPEFLMRNSLLVSVIDGSLIDLAARDHLKSASARGCLIERKMQRALGKRSFGGSFGNLPGDFPKNSTKKLKIERAFEWHFPRKINGLGLISPSLKNEKAQKAGAESWKSESKSGPIETHVDKESPTAEKFLDDEAPLILKKVKREDIKDKHKSYKSLIDDTKDGVAPKKSRKKRPSRKTGSRVKPSRSEASQSGGASDFVEILNCLHFIFENRKNSEILETEQIKLKKLLDRTGVQSSDFGGLSRFMTKFLSERELAAEDLRMSDLELVMFAFFIVKKKFQDLEGLEWDAASLNRLKSAPTKKTSEQNYKIIFKRFFKLVVQDFNRRHRLSPADTCEFYRAHFGAVAEAMGQDWRDLEFKFVFNEYRDKRMSKQGRHSKKKFARVLKNSPAFMQLFRSYLGDRLSIQGRTHGIFVDYLPVIDKKLLQMIRRWRAKFKSNKNIKSRLCKYLIAQLKNDKIKLPWGFGEIRQAICNVDKLFDRAS